MGREAAETQETPQHTPETDVEDGQGNGALVVPARADSDLNAREDAEKPRPRRQHNYTEAEIEKGLFAVALSSGNTRRASSVLERRDIHIPSSTLDHRKNHSQAERYNRIQCETYPKIQDNMAEQMEALFAAEVDLEWELIEKFREELPNLKAGEVAGALRNVGVSKALNVDKSAPLRGRPNEVVAHVSAEEALRKLKRFKGVVIESTAEEVEE